MPAFERYKYSTPMHYLVKGPLRRAVANLRNSTSVLPMAELDWRYWWTDVSGYLHVAHMDGERWSRVRCRLTDKPRLQMKDGVLIWLIDREQDSITTEQAK